MTAPSHEHARALRTYARIGRWGTCVDCPRSPDNHDVFPEFCSNTDRYDHRLMLGELARTIEHADRAREERRAFLANPIDPDGMGDD